METTSKRNNSIDILKGIGILLMVIGHTGFQQKNFIYMFHMAIFFIASGYLFKEKMADSFTGVLSFVVKKIKGLWVPYFIWNMIFTLLNNVFINLHIYESIEVQIDNGKTSLHNYLSISEMIKNIVKGIFFSGRTEMGGACWFFQILFMISCLYCVISFCIRRVTNNKNKCLFVQIVISVMFLILGYVMQIKGFSHLGIDRTMSCYWLFCFGDYLGNFVCEGRIIGNTLRCILAAVSFLLLLILYIVTNYEITISLGSNYYLNALFFVIVSTIGWILIYEIAVLIDNNTSLLSKFLAVLGKNSMSIVIFHFLAFKLVSILICNIYLLPYNCIATFPTIDLYSGWWILYTIVGISVPIGLSFVVSKMKKFVIDIYTSKEK